MIVMVVMEAGLYGTWWWKKDFMVMEVVEAGLYDGGGGGFGGRIG